jgi:hypothetical protein
VRFAVLLALPLLAAACQPKAAQADKAENIDIVVDTEGGVTASRNGKPMTQAELESHLAAGEPKR